MSILPLVRGTFAGLFFALSVSAAGNSEPFEGVVEVTLIRIGTQAVHFQFTGKANRLRIENTTNKLDPINVLDLGTNKLTIVYPHNTTYVVGDLVKRATAHGGTGSVASPESGTAQGSSLQQQPSPSLPQIPALPMMPSIPPLGAAGSADLKKTDKTRNILFRRRALEQLRPRGKFGNLGD